MVLRKFLFYSALQLMLTTDATQVYADQFGTFEGVPLFSLDRQEISKRCSTPDYTPGDHDRIVLTTFNYRDPKGLYWTVPAGACVNGASIPKAFWSFIGGPLSGKYVEASIVHDHFCKAKTRSSHDTHRAFYNGMRAGGVSENLATVMYQAVAWFGPTWTTVKVKNEQRTITGRNFLYYAVIDELAKLANQEELSELEMTEFISRAKELAKQKRPSAVPQIPKNCSVLVPEIVFGTDFSGSLVVCDTTKENTKLVALQNLRNLQRTLRGLLAANMGFLFIFDNYLQEPTKDRWESVVSSTKATRVVISEAMRAWFKVNNIEPADPENVMNRINHLLASRTAILGDLLISGEPAELSRAREIFEKYNNLKRKLEIILNNWEKDLEASLSDS